MGDEQLRAAVIGVGFIGAVHARAIRLAGGQLWALAASTPDSARAAAATLGAGRIYSSPDELAADDALDVVHVCTPNSLHRPFVLAALEAGKHVVCEKPLGLDLAQALELRDRARRADVITAMPFVYRFYPMIRELRQRVEVGMLGRLRLAHGSYLQDWLADTTVANWRRDPATGGRSRAFADIGAHWCDLVEFVAGDEIERVSASLLLELDARQHDGATEDAALVQFETARGMRGTVLVSQISHGHKNHLTLELGGTEASAGFDQERPDVLRFNDRAGSHLLHRGTAAMSTQAQAFSLLPPGHPQGFNVAQAYDAIRHPGAELSGLDGLPTFEDGAHAAAIVDAVLESARTRQWCDVGDRAGASGAVRTRDAGAVATGDGQPAPDAGPARHAAALQARGGRVQG